MTDTLFKPLSNAIKAVIESADNEGCTPDLTVVSQQAITELEDQYNLFFDDDDWEKNI